MPMEKEKFTLARQSLRVFDALNQDITRSEAVRQAIRYRLDHEHPLGPTENVGVTIPPELLEEITAQLGYGDSRSEWIRRAVEMMVIRECAAHVLEQSI